MEETNVLKYPPVALPKKIKDQVRYPKVQLRYEGEFQENYSKMLKVLKVGIIKFL